jgi:hypothetical protein
VPALTYDTPSSLTQRRGAAGRDCGINRRRGAVISRTELIPSRRKAKTWTDDEDKILKKILVEAQGILGNRWTNIAQLLLGMSGENVWEKN